MSADPQLSIGLTSFAASDPDDWAPLVNAAVAADEAGFDRLVVSDHVVFGERLDEYGRPEIGGQAGGRQPTGPDGHWLEPLSTLAFLAGQTSNIRIGTNILLAALRRPVVLAKMASTIDVLSNGRLDLGVGVGWQREEYDAAGLAFEDRGHLLDECLRICQVLWKQDRASYESAHLQFDRIHMMPKPLQAGGVPIWVSGTVNKRVARRLAEFGNGWIPWGDAAADPVSAIRAMGELLSDHGRDIGEMQVVGSLPVRRSGPSIDLPATMGAVPEMAAAGVTDFRVMMRVPPTRDEAADVLTPLVAAFKAAAGGT